MTDKTTLSIQGRTTLKPNQDIGGLIFEIGSRNPKDIAFKWPGSKRDQWLRLFVHQEGNEIVQGVIAGILAKLSGLSWEISGTRGVHHFQNVLQDAEFGAGFAVLLAKTMQDFYSSDAGAFWEIIGSETRSSQLNGPLVAPVTGIAHLDSNRCYLTGNDEYPVVWCDPVDGNQHRLHWTRVHRLTDMPSPDVLHRGYGFCAASRLISSATFMQKLATHKLEAVDEQLAPGLLTISGSRVSLKDAQKDYEEERANLGLNYLKPIMTLESIDPEKPINAEFIPFSELPKWFQEKDQYETYARLVALAFGIDFQDVWPIGGSLGSGQQSEVLHQKGKGKSLKQVIKLLERAINQHILPPNLEFKFVSPDLDEENDRADLDTKYIGHAESLKRLGLTTDFIARRLTEQGVLDIEDFEAELPTLIGNDTESEPNKVGGPEDVAAAQDEESDVDEDDAEKAEKALDAFLIKASGSFAVLQKNYLGELQAALTNYSTGQYAKRNVDSAFKRAIGVYFEEAFLLGQIDGGVDDAIDKASAAWLKTRVSQERTYAGNLINEMARDLRLAKSASAKGTVTARYMGRLPMWATTLNEIYHQGMIAAKSNQMLEWVLGSTLESCPTCLAAAGQRHRAKDWMKYNLSPQGPELLCGGYNCDCQLKPTKEKAKGRLDRIPTKTNPRGWRRKGSGWVKSGRKALTDAFTAWRVAA